MKITETTEEQRKIIEDHKKIEGAENMEFVPCTNGKTVYAVDKTNGEVIAINKSNK